MGNQIDKEMRKIINKLNLAQNAYDLGAPMMTDREWDTYFFRLQKLESIAHKVFPDSPTNKIKFDFVTSLRKVKHNHLMLSLAKTKEYKEVSSFIGDKPFVAMLKMDGLTCSLHYQSGKLVSAETRGDGIEGEDILHNAKWMRGLPRHIEYQGPLTVDGEVIITYEDMNMWNAAHHANATSPRNVAAGAIRRFKAEESAEFGLRFIAWDIIEDVCDYFSEKLNKLSDFGFDVVPNKICQTTSGIESIVANLQAIAKNASYPIDGIVFKFNDIAYGASLGSTAHHFNNAIAYKFIDDLFETRLLDVEWTIGRTGVLTPVAIFEPVEIYDTKVTKASLHNISVMKTVMCGDPYKWQPIKVTKSNMIIPQVIQASPPVEGIKVEYFSTPATCPECGEGTSIQISPDGVQTLLCTNQNCIGRMINRLDHFVSNKGLNIKGLSKSTLEKLYNADIITCRKDIFTLGEKINEIVKLPGLGQKSAMGLLTAITKATENIELWRVIAACGIPLIGSAVAKKLAIYFKSYKNFRQEIEDDFDFTELEDFGFNMNEAIHTYDFSEIDYIVQNYLNIEEISEKQEKDLEGMYFVVTGKIGAHFKNRSQLQLYIEQMGGKVQTAVGKKTNYLIANKKEDTIKYRAALELGTPIITEQEFYNLKKI